MTAVVILEPRPRGVAVRGLVSLIPGSPGSPGVQAGAETALAFAKVVAEG